MRRYDEMPAEALDPIARRPEEIHLFLMLLLGGIAFLGRHVAAVPGRLGLVEDGRVVAAVERNIRLHKEMVGKQPAAVSEQHLEHAAGPGPFAPALRPRLDDRGEAEAGRQQEQQDQERNSSFHKFNGLRRNTSQVANSSSAA